MTTAQPEDAFKHLDHDGDGAITRTDFEQVAESVVAKFNLSPTSQKAAALRSGYLEAWDLLRNEVDADQDGQLTRDEFAAATARLAGGQQFSSNVAQVSGAEFDAADADDDGVLDREAFIRLVEALSHTTGDVSEVFTRLDQDGDGRVSRSEYVSASTDYLSSGEANSFGSRVFAGI